MVKATQLFVVYCLYCYCFKVRETYTNIKIDSSRNQCLGLELYSRPLTEVGVILMCFDSFATFFIDLLIFIRWWLKTFGNDRDFHVDFTFCLFVYIASLSLRSYTSNSTDLSHSFHNHSWLYIKRSFPCRYRSTTLSRS